MKFNLLKNTVGIAVASLFALGASNASAIVFPDFTVVAPTGQTFVADKITGNYVEVATFTNSGTFSTSLFFDAGQFVANDGSTPVKNTGLFSNYQLYAVLNSSGTFTPTSTGGTNFTFTPGTLPTTGGIQVFLDKTNDTVATVSGPGFTLAGNSDAILIAEGLVLSGSGGLDPSKPSCSNGINCGSFGTTTSFMLTPAGTKFFTEPKPFYPLSFQSGQLNNFPTSAGSTTINGSADVVFAAADVPEPASVALLGLGLLGLGATLRRKSSK